MVFISHEFGVPPPSLLLTFPPLIAALVDTGHSSPSCHDDHGERRCIPRTCRHQSSRRGGPNRGGCQHHHRPVVHVRSGMGHDG